MTSFLLRPRTLLLVASLFALPFAGGGGCNQRQACFTFTSAEFAKAGNSCPVQSHALENFSDPNCPGSVTSVDSAGDFDPLDGTTGICCYTVTYADITPDCGASPGGQGGTSNNVGGFSSGDAVGGSATFAESVGVGGMGGNTPGCFSCSDMIQGVNEDPQQICTDSQPSADSLRQCACSNTCSVCSDTLCVQLPPSSACFDCMTSMCGSQLVDCESH